ncbi:uncharacterized protein LOC120213701 [Hibiscus syriacus]|uniref:uncharacterized protein LOC120213701 n=1 Tax=Hibiscus syriacus TaxID=106335 RepID=UPI0019232FF9|nr:uncharacterized protein LOC120213701 [Hibiscus syriacus]
MDNEEKIVSVLQVDELFLRKILSRDDSSLDDSVHIPHRRSVGAIPFQWELEPGTPKHRLVSDKEIVSPIKPPSRTMSRMSQERNKQCMNDARETRPWFWKKSKKKTRGKDKTKSDGNIGFDNPTSSPSTSSGVTLSRLRRFAKIWYKCPF